MKKGIGPVLAERLVNEFGLDTLSVMEHTPEQIYRVKGFGKKKGQAILKQWANQVAIQDIMLFLHIHGISSALATKIFQLYGPAAIAMVEKDPYRLARDLPGIGFLTADKIANSLNVPKDSELRIQSAIRYQLQESLAKGLHQSITNFESESKIRFHPEQIQAIHKGVLHKFSSSNPDFAVAFVFEEFGKTTGSKEVA